MSLEMRELTGKDLFPMLSLIGKLNIKDSVLGIIDKNNATNAQTDEAIERQGTEMMISLLQDVLENIQAVEKDLNKLLASVTDKKVKEIEELSFDAYTDLIFTFFEKPELKDFLVSTVERFGGTISTD